MIDEACQAVLDHWERLPVSLPRPRRLQHWVDGTGAEKVSVFLFPDQRAEPCLVLKLARSRAGARPLRRAHRVVGRLRSLCPDHVRLAIPEQALLELPGGRWVIAEQYVAGTPISRLMADRRRIGSEAAQLLAPALQWLWEFHQATRMSVGARAQTAGTRLIDRETAEFRRTFPLSTTALAFLEQTRDAGVAWLASGGALVPVHGDFEPGNVLLSREGIRILDWGFGRPIGLPGFDLLFLLLRFLTRVAGLSRLGSTEAEYRRMVEDVFWTGSWQRRLVQDALQEHWRQLGFPSVGLGTVLGLCLVTAANAYYRYLLDRAEWGWLFLPPRTEPRSFRDALREIVYAQWFEHLSDNHDRLLWRQLG